MLIYTQRHALVNGTRHLNYGADYSDWPQSYFQEQESSHGTVWYRGESTSIDTVVAMFLVVHHVIQSALTLAKPTRSNVHIVIIRYIRTFGIINQSSRFLQVGAVSSHSSGSGAFGIKDKPFYHGLIAETWVVEPLVNSQ
jgi:hypothetical protein